MSKHTSGPWEPITRDGEHVPGEPDYHITSNKGTVAGVFDIGECGEAYENSRLLAAAPEMLEALKGALKLLEFHYPKPARNGQIARARAAIAKAEGRV